MAFLRMMLTEKLKFVKRKLSCFEFHFCRVRKQNIYIEELKERIETATKERNAKSMLSFIVHF